MLKEITSTRQKKNGTRAFLCEKSGAIYTSHSSGYVRRKTKNGSQYPLNVRTRYTSVSWEAPLRVTYTYHKMIHPEFRRIAFIKERAKSYQQRVI